MLMAPRMNLVYMAYCIVKAYGEKNMLPQLCMVKRGLFYKP